jgi:hypothetical protein
MFKKISLYFSAFALMVIVVSSLFGTNLLEKLASAQLVRACTAGETLSGDNCTFTKVAVPKYQTGCVAGYELMDAICVQATNKTCADFKNALPAESGLCKVDANAVLVYEIVDFDGRHCNGSAYNLKRYNVGLPQNSQNGVVICGNSFNTTSGKENFRFYPKVITGTKNIETIKTGEEFPACPSNYTEAPNNQCSRPAVAQTCSQGGEVFDGSKCNVCPAGQYCPNNGIVSKTMTVCANGGTLTGSDCVAPIKYNVTTYTDGCSTGFTRMDQSCAIIENRTHDTGCSYFYTSNNKLQTAVLGSDGLCSTGGSVDFNTTDIYKVADLQCNGDGTAYYNYNVFYDPTVCGNDYTVVGKGGFKWLPTTYSKITALQKLPSQTMVCPPTWVDAGGNNCKQAPITQEYKDPVNCPINTYCPAGSNQPTPCPAGTVSPMNSKVATDCTPIPCTNGAINPPACNTCPANKDFVSNVCKDKCPTGVNRDTSGNCTVCVNGAINPSAGCTTCPTGYTMNNGTCTITVVSSSSSSVVSSSISSSSNSSANSVSSSSSSTAIGGGCERGFTNYPACNQCQADKEVITLNGVQNCVYRCQGTQVRDANGNCGFNSSSVSSMTNSSSSVVSSSSSVVSSSSSMVSSSSTNSNTNCTFYVTGNVGGVFPNINLTNCTQNIPNNTPASITFTKTDGSTVVVNGQIINKTFVPNTGSVIPTGIVINSNINLAIVVSGYSNINGTGNFTNNTSNNPTQVITINNNSNPTNSNNTNNTTTVATNNTPATTNVVQLTATNNNTNYQTTVRTGGFDPMAILTTISATSIIAWVYLQKRNRNLKINN